MFFFTSILDFFINRYDFNADISCVDRFTEVYYPGFVPEFKVRSFCYEKSPM